MVLSLHGDKGMAVRLHAFMPPVQRGMLPQSQRQRAGASPRSHLPTEIKYRHSQCQMTPR